MAGDCGSCTACCRVYSIPELQKPAGKWCDHCAIGDGCKVYERRPKTCVEFECLWLQSQQRPERERMDAELRPDRCKVVFSLSTDSRVMSAVMLPGYPVAFRRSAVWRMIENMVKGGMRVVAGLPMAATMVMIDKRGEHEVRMTPPDENGIQWNADPDPEMARLKRAPLGSLGRP